MPWAKGQSGNPNGRRPIGKTLAEALRRAAQPKEVAKVIVGIILDKTMEPHYRLAAAKIYCEYAYGKPGDAAAIEKAIADANQLELEYESKVDRPLLTQLSKNPEALALARQLAEVAISQSSANDDGDGTELH